MESNQRRPFGGWYPLPLKRARKDLIATGLLKLYLRELPDPLLTRDLKPEFAAAVGPCILAAFSVTLFMMQERQT